MVKWKIKQGHLEAVLKDLPNMVEMSSKEPGNLIYEVSQSEVDDHVLCLYEVYKDENALEEHKISEHYQKLVVEQIIPLLEEREVVRLKPLFGSIK